MCLLWLDHMLYIMYVKVRALGQAEVSPSPTLNKSSGRAFSGQFEGPARARLMPTPNYSYHCSHNWEIA